MNLFGSPPRIHPSAMHNVIPFKKTKTEVQMGEVYRIVEKREGGRRKKFIDE